MFYNYSYSDTVNVPNVTSLSETNDENRLGTVGTPERRGAKEPVVLREPRSKPAVSVPTGYQEMTAGPVNEERPSSVGWNTQRVCRDDRDEATTVQPKRYSYAGPPKISLSTWNERPKRQVSIKTDQDYVTGIRQRLQQKAAGGGIGAPQDDGVVAESKARGDGVVGANNKSTVSRVPIVKSVELKKPYAERLHTVVSPVTLALSDVIRAQAKLSNGYGGYRGSVVVLPTAGDDDNDDRENKAAAVATVVESPKRKPTTVGLRYGGDDDKVEKVIAAESPERKPFTFGKLMMTNRSRRPREISPNVDPRQSLLESIRTFGGRDSLKKIRV